MLGDKLTPAQQQLVQEGLRLSKFDGSALVDVPSNAYPGSNNEALRIPAGRLGELCLHLFNPRKVPTEALRLTLEAWRVAEQEAGSQG